ncbi:MAG: gamma-glutamyl-gamma-aminobutyrate hydrolase family protein [Kiritimatiellae bacterium]|nr:gamma-glutamyl-gamma-aminobutyrate hydrolase family protein [Kiritimatiellia bacterium]
MILVVSMRNRKDYDQRDGATGFKCRVEHLTGKPVLTMHYANANPVCVNAVNPRAIIITGSPDPWPTIRISDLYGLNDILHTTKIPLLAICQGHQLIGHCFNRDLHKVHRLPDEPMRKCRPGEPDTGAVKGHPGYYYADAFVEVKILRADPVLAGLGRSFRVRESHRCEIKKLPWGFIHLAKSTECNYEMIRHGTRLLYGTQFHAERWEKPYMDGRTILVNFFKLAGVL